MPFPCFFKIEIFINKIKELIFFRKERNTLESTAQLAEFVDSHAAYVAQTSLYGYLKTRMGTQYRTIFVDPKFSPSLNGAKWRIYAACLEDLSVFAAALLYQRMTQHQTADPPAAPIPASSAPAALAQRFFTQAAAGNFSNCEIADLQRESSERLAQRLCELDLPQSGWAQAAEGENAFSGSAQALVQHAPVSEAYRQLDRQIVTNSIRFRWRETRSQLRARLDAEKVYCDFTAHLSQQTPSSPTQIGLQ